MSIRRIIPKPIVSLYHFAWALAGAMWYGFPSRRITIIGVTGTKGKTTVTELVGAILEAAGNKVALANGIRFKIGDHEEPNLLKMTMPGRGRLQKFLRRAVHAGCTYAVLEVTSEGISQHRHRFIRFAVAALTNLQREHLEAHGSFEAYRSAKGALFKHTPGIHVLNADDPNVEYFRQFRSKEKIYFSERDCAAYRPFQPASLPGEFNLSNICCAAAIAQSLGIPQDAIREALSRFPGVPGRMQFIQKEPFAVVVDYAHTPDSLEAAYTTLREALKPHRMVCVLGAAGNRDSWKRPIMGELAARYCDRIILTNEDPYDEPQEQIIREIASGIENVKFKSQNSKLQVKMQNYQIVVDRREAIREAIRSAEAGDAVVITGKGAERFMVIGKKKIPWSDIDIAKSLLATPNL
jgi:UDP-N-acetylmuramoyl-L-alanyl-D-glutamate--2,6-diaminopimelate ligase